MKKEEILAFVMFNYTPFNKIQCIKRLLVIWIASLALNLIGAQDILSVLLLGAFCLLLSVIFILMIAKYSHLQVSRYLCDGIFYLYVAVLFNIASYRVMTLQIGSNWLLAVMLMLLLMVCIFIFFFVTLLNIKLGKFSKAGPPKRVVSLPVLFGAFGIITARLFLQGESQDVALTVVSYVLLILSFITSIPSLNLLKALFYSRSNSRTGDRFA